MARNLVVALGGAVGAVVLATALSPFTPVGEARLAEPSTGISFAALIILLGALATVIVVLALGIWPAARAAFPLRSDDAAVMRKPSVVVGGLTAVGVPPSMLIGVRNALQRRASGATVPLGTAFLGTVLAVIALTGTAVFGSSLSHLTATPSLYGDNYRLTFTVIPGLPDPALLQHVEHDDAVDVIMRALAGQVSIDRTTVGALAVEPLRGPLPLSTVKGHLPHEDGQIGLGAATMRQVHAHVGSLIKVTVSTPTGGRRTEPFRVVSQIPLPVVGGYVGLGNGALFTVAGYEATVCPTGSGREGACRQEVAGATLGAIVTNMVSGARGDAAVTHFLDTYPEYASLPVTPTSLINFGEAVNFPLIFGAIVAIFGAATLAHLLVASVSRRRRETGLLKVLGFTNRQVISSVAWQATTLTVVGVAVGVPLGDNCRKGDVEPVRWTDRLCAGSRRTGLAHCRVGDRRHRDRQPARNRPGVCGNASQTGSPRARTATKAPPSWRRCEGRTQASPRSTQLWFPGTDKGERDARVSSNHACGVDGDRARTQPHLVPAALRLRPGGR